VDWRAFELHPGIPPEGQLIPWPPERIAQGRAAFERMARAAGLPYGERTHWYNTDLAHEATEWARDHDVLEPTHHAIMRAYFVDDRNIGSLEVLVDLARGLGLDAADLETALTDRRYRERVQDQYAEARELGITAVPTFVAGEFAVVGAQPEEVFERLMRAPGASRRSGSI
jgi:predicted DsbA family dithiol-disulfide isomerase